MQNNTIPKEKDWFRDGISRAHYVRRAGMELVTGLGQGVQEQNLKDDARTQLVECILNITKSVNDEYEEQMKKLEQEWHYTDQTFQQFVESVELTI